MRAPCRCVPVFRNRVPLELAVSAQRGTPPKKIKSWCIRLRSVPIKSYRNYENNPGRNNSGAQISMNRTEPKYAACQFRHEALCLGVRATFSLNPSATPGVVYHLRFFSFPFLLRCKVLPSTQVDDLFLSEREKKGFCVLGLVMLVAHGIVMSALTRPSPVWSHSTRPYKHVFRPARTFQPIIIFEPLPTKYKHVSADNS